MAFEFKPDRHYLGFWHARLPQRLSRHGKGGNVCYLLWREQHPPDQPWILQWRFRHYVDDKIFGSADTVRWFSHPIACSGDGLSAQEVLALAEGLLEAFAKMGRLTLDFYPMDCDGAVAIQRFTDNPPPFMHIQQVLTA